MINLMGFANTFIRMAAFVRAAKATGHAAQRKALCSGLIEFHVTHAEACALADELRARRHA